MLDLRPILVSNARGEEREFTMTRAGIYLLAKFTAKGEQEPNDIAAYLLKKGILEDLGVERDWYRYFASKSKNGVYNEWFFCWCGDLVNVVVLRGSRERARKEDGYKVGESYYPQSYRKYVKNCDECHERYFDQELLEAEDVFDDVDLNSIGIDGYCHDCVSEYTDYRQCEDCGHFHQDYEMEYSDGADGWICQDCIQDHYTRCHNCGALINTECDDYEYVDETGNYYCCGSCAEEDGNEWDDDCDCFVPCDSNKREIDQIISDYHSHDYRPMGSTKATQKHQLLIGVETEVDNYDRYEQSYDYYKKLRDELFGGKVFFEKDGSLNQGFEIISQPLTEDLFFKTDWETPFSDLVNVGFRSHYASNTGTHFHFSDWYLGYTDNQKIQSALKICRFFQLFAEDISKIARRNYNGYCANLNDYDLTIDADDRHYYNLRNSRYWAVNLTNMLKSRTKSTIEIRVCKGTLKASTMLASADFFLHIVRNAKNIAWKNISDLKQWFNGIKNPNTIDYIKSRNAFEGAF